MAKKANPRTAQQPVPRSFEEALSELESMLHDLETDDVGLEETLVRYERGTFLIRHCRKVLANAERQIAELGRADDGTPTLTPASPPDPSRPSPDPSGDLS